VKHYGTPNQTAPTAAPLAAVTVFDPWPFMDDFIDLTVDWSYIDGVGRVCRPDQELPTWFCLNLGRDRILATDTDGNHYVTSADGLGAYCALNHITNPHSD